MSEIVIITGIPGSGKTTVLNKTLKKIKKKYEVVNYGTIMMEEAKKHGVKNRDELRKLPAKTQDKIQTLSGKKIAKLGKRNNIIVDTHCTIKTPKGYLIGLPENVLKELKPNKIILIETKIKDIKKRREKDKSRKRDVEVLEEMDTQQKLNRAVATICGAISKAKIIIIENPQNRIEVAVSKLVRILK